jgi:hypothetical protein
MRLRHSRWWTVIVVLASSLLVFPAGVAAGEPPIRADLEGKPIPAVEVGDWFCHDFEYPAIHCFRSAAGLDAAVADLGLEPLTPDTNVGEAVAQTSPAAASALSYVRVFVDANYSGGSAYFSVNYSNLGLIGWNDKISSYVALNSLSGQFWENTSYWGLLDSFCCNQLVSYVGDAYNDKFSSVRKT